MVDSDTTVDVYEISVDGVVRATVPSTQLTFHVDGLTPNSSYRLGVRARDQKGQWSKAPLELTASTSGDEENDDAPDGDNGYVTASEGLPLTYQGDSNYYQFVESPRWLVNGATPASERCGSKALINMTYDVATRFGNAHPDTRLKLGDMNAPGHASHKRGVDVDIFGEGSRVAHVNGNRAYSVELGKMFVDSRIVDVIFYNDPAVRSAVNAYAGRAVMQPWPNHENHFHVRISSTFKLSERQTCPSPVTQLSPMAPPSTPPPPVTGPSETVIPAQDFAGEVFSPAGTYSLIMQGDGNLVVYRTAGHVPVWASGTSKPGTWLSIQSDGNVVLRTPGNIPIRETKTYGHAGATVSVQEDGNVVVYSATHQALWASNSHPEGMFYTGPLETVIPVGTFTGEVFTPDGNFSLIMQGDGNLVLYRTVGHVAVWASGTSTPGTLLTVQTDGNVVLRAPGNIPIRSTRTSGHPGATLSLQEDGNLVVYSTSRQALWASKAHPEGMYS